MGVRQWMINWLEAGRMKNEPDRQTDAYPFPFGWFGGWGKGQPTMKRTPANLRSLSESPIPRRAINVIKDGIAKLDWSVTAINETEQEKYQEICNVLSNVMRKPNQSDSFRLWIEQIVEDMLVASAGSSELLQAGDKLRPLRMYPVDTFSIELYPNWDGKRDSYRYAQHKPQGGYVHLTDSELMYIRMNPRTNTPFGLSPLESVWESVNHFIGAHKSAGNQAKNTFIRKLLNLGKGAGTDAIKAYRAYWENEVQGRGMMPIIGGENPSVLDLGATDDKALFLEWQRFLIEVIAISFGVSPKKLGQTKDVNRSTADSEDDDTQATIQSIADTIAEHINNEIIDGRFNMGSVIKFKFKYATSLKDQKTQAEINDIYIKNGTYVLDEVRDSLGKKAHKNKLGEVILFPTAAKVIDTNKPLEEQTPATTNPPLTPDPNNPNVKSRRMKASDDKPTDTDEVEKAFIAAYLLLMMSILRRDNNVSSVSSLSYVWTPRTYDVQSLSESLSKLKGDSWLKSYNRRRQEMNAERLSDVPSGTMDDISSLSDERAQSIMDTYAEEMKNRLNEAEQRYAGLVGSEKEKAILDDMEAWLTTRMAYKSSQISGYEAGESWNQALFAHDKEHAPETEYYVQPVATNHADCANIIAGAPYTADTIPADLPLHPNCPHRYYAVVYD
ncbi:MAG: phage portal protein [Bacilli bacterium]|nr:phage portal protein [Bacilli bacterium]